MNASYFFRVWVWPGRLYKDSDEEYIMYSRVESEDITIKQAKEKIKKIVRNNWFVVLEIIEISVGDYYEGIASKKFERAKLVY